MMPAHQVQRMPEVGLQEAVFLSILIPVYNAQEFVADCLQSILAQVGAGVEVIVLDDCSTDDSLHIVQSLCEQHMGGVTILRHGKNQGVSVARNALLDVARGEYVWFMDADDKLAPGAVDEVRNALYRHNPDLLLFDFQVLRNKTKLKHRLRGESHRRTFAGPANVMLQDTSRILCGMFLAGQFHPWSKVVRRSCWGEQGSDGVRFPPGQCFTEDMAVFSRMALRVRTAFYLPKPLVLYRQHGANAMAQMSVQKMWDLSGTLKQFSIEFQHAMQNEMLAQRKKAAFAVSHVSLRNYLGAIRFLRNNPQAGQPQIEDELALNFRQTSPLRPEELLRSYLRRGWLLRYVRARRAMKALGKRPMP